MKISARTRPGGTIGSIASGSVNGEIRVGVGGGHASASTITEATIPAPGWQWERVIALSRPGDVLIGQ